MRPAFSAGLPGSTLPTKNGAGTVDSVMPIRPFSASTTMATAIEIARQRIPGLQVVSIRDGGHAVTLDQPEATNSALKSFHLAGVN